MSGISSLTPGLRPYATELVALARSYGDRPRIISAFRSIRTQKRLHEDFLSGRSNVVAAPPGRSLHNYGHAFDLVVSTPEAQEWLGRVWEAWGGRWGGAVR